MTHDDCEDANFSDPLI